MIVMGFNFGQSDVRLRAMVVCRLDQGLYLALQRVAEEQGTNMSQVVRQLLDKGVNDDLFSP